MSVLYPYRHVVLRDLHSFPTRRSSDLRIRALRRERGDCAPGSEKIRHTIFAGRSPPPRALPPRLRRDRACFPRPRSRSEEHTSELQSLTNLVCRLLLEKKNTRITTTHQ